MAIRGLKYPPCRSSDMTELNPNYNCPKTECPRHGKCMECVEFHKANSDKIPFCLRFMVEVK